jgi:pimeloyl-ACP methyl ester carboxylesterase
MALSRVAFFVAVSVASALRAEAACGASCVPTQGIGVAGVSYAYRAFGPSSGTPLVFLNRFRGTMDDWDPAFLDRVARTRRVIIFDNAGVARSGGETPERMSGWVANVLAFVDALGLARIDLLGFSFGGLVAQEVTLTRPDLVRRLIIVGSGAGYVKGANVPPGAITVATKPVNTDEDFLYLFFRESLASQQAGRDYLTRLRRRTDAFAKLVSEPAWRAMLSASSDVGTPETSLLNRAGAIAQPVLVANGNEDVMIPTYQSFALSQAMPNARLVIYPNSGHAFMFQYPEAFGDEVVRFLEDKSSP